MSEILIVDQNEDYGIKGYFKKQTFNNLGYNSINEFYFSYDEGTQTFSNLMVKETIVVTNNAYGIPMKAVTGIEWYFGADIAATKTVTKLFDTQAGIAYNKIAFNRVFDTASVYLISQIGLDNARLILQTLSNECSLYIMGTRQPLLDAITNSTNVLLTPTIKGTLNTILNINYLEL